MVEQLDCASIRVDSDLVMVLDFGIRETTDQSLIRAQKSEGWLIMR